MSEKDQPEQSAGQAAEPETPTSGQQQTPNFQWQQSAPGTQSGPQASQGAPGQQQWQAGPEFKARANSIADSIKRLNIQRGPDKWAGGVCSGVARRLGIDPLIVRGIWVLTFFLGGTGLLLYILAWLLLPDYKTGRSHGQNAVDGKLNRGLLITFIVVAAIIVAGPVISIVSGLFGGAWGLWGGYGGIGSHAFGRFLGLLVVIGIIILIVRVATSHRHHEGKKQPGQEASAAAPFTAPASTPEAEAKTTTAAMPVTSGPPPTKAPRKPKRKGVGVILGGIVYGLVLAALAIVAIIATGGHNGVGAGRGPLIVVGILLLILGVGTVIAGIIGRKSGAFAAAAIPLLVLSLPIAAAYQMGFFSNSSSIGTATWTPQTSEVRTNYPDWKNDSVLVGNSSSGGYSWGIGTATLDLTKLSVPHDQHVVTVPVQIGMGKLTVIVPKNDYIMVNTTLQAGVTQYAVTNDWDITWSQWSGTNRNGEKHAVPSRLPNQNGGPVIYSSNTIDNGNINGWAIASTASSPGAAGLYTNQADAATAKRPLIVVTITGGAGNVTVQEGN